VSLTATRPRIGFLGLGWIGGSRFEALRSSGLVELGPVADPNLPDALNGLDELLEHELDGVAIATPSALHAEQALAVLERGLPVFCQKPLGRTAAETLAVVEAARASDLLLGVDLSYRHAKAFRRAHELVRGGAVGAVQLVDLVFHNAYGPDKDWFYDPEVSGGGCLIDLGIHLVDLAVWMLDLRPETVSGRLVGAPVEHLATATLDHVRLACSWRLHAGREAVIEATVYGTDGAVSVRNVGGSFYDFCCELHRGTTSELLVEPPDDWGGRAAVDWAARIARGERFDPATRELVRVAEILDRIYGR
jgi:predicted dehydrogenase